MDNFNNQGNQNNQQNPYGATGQGNQQNPQGGAMGPDYRRTMVLAGGAPPIRRRWPGLKIFAVILAVCVLLLFISAVACSSDDDKPNGPYVGIIYVEGTIQSGNEDAFGITEGYQHRWTLNQIDEMMEDPNNLGLMLYVDSPGGGVYESDELYLKIREYQETTDNPVYTYMGSMAASGGYYIAASSDQIFANRNTWTGSIGVTLGTFYDFSGFLSRYGVKTETLTSGANKAMGSSVEPMTPEQKAIWQSLIDEAYAQFVGIVADGREMSVERVKELADGRIYTAKQALDAGLIDGITDFNGAMDDMRENYDLGDCEFVDITYEGTSFLGNLLSGTAELLNLKKEGTEAGAILALTKNRDLPISYTCEWLAND